jgi:hypothetical protein
MGEKNSGEFKASGMFSAEGVQPAELQEKPAVATCCWGTVSISAGRHWGNTGETCVEMANCRIFWMLKVRLKIKSHYNRPRRPRGEYR